MEREARESSDGDVMLKQQTDTEPLPYDTEPVPEEGIDLVAVAAALLGEWKIALFTFAVVSTIGLVYVFHLKPEYVASASFLPSQGRTEAESLSSIFSARGSGNLYIGLLNSRSVQDEVIDRAHLKQVFGTTSTEYARYLLAQKSGFSAGGDDIIRITVRDGNAANAATIANAYLEGLQDLNDKMAQAQAAQTRRFYDRQLEQERAELNQAEDAFARLQQRTGQVAPSTQAAIGIGNIANTRSQIQALEVQLAVLRQSEADSNPDVQRLRLQIAQLEGQEHQEEASTATPAGAPTTAARIPTINLEIDRAQREVSGRSALVGSLSSQFGAARLDEEFSHPALQIIDRAYAPEGRAWPPRENYEMASLGFGVFAALFAVVIKLIAGRILANPVHRAAIRRLRRAF